MSNNLFEDRENGTSNLEEILGGGPAGVIYESKPSTSQTLSQPQANSMETPSSKEEREFSDKEKMEKILSDARAEIVMPSPEKIAQLKAQSNGNPLKVFPVPDWKGDGKPYAFILKRIAFAQWKAISENAAKIAEAKPNTSVEVIMALKVISASLVYPNIREDFLSDCPAGLIETLYEAIREHCLFYDPSYLMRLSYTL